MTEDLRVHANCLDLYPISHIFHHRDVRHVPGVRYQRKTSPLHIAQCDRVGNLADPSVKGAFKSVLMQIPMDSQKGLLTEILRILTMVNDSVNDAPAQPLM